MKTTSFVGLMVAVYAGCVARGGPTGGEHEAPWGAPPFSVEVEERGAELALTLTARTRLDGVVTIVVEEETGPHATMIAARTGTTRIQRAGAVGDWTLTARWVDPWGRAGATAVARSQHSHSAESPAPTFVPIARSRVGALPVSSAIAIPRPSGAPWRP